MKVRMIAMASCLFWCESNYKDQLLLQSMQRALKISNEIIKDEPKHVGLWPELLDKYIFYTEIGVEGFTIDHINSLIALSKEHIAFARDSKEVDAGKEAREAQAHLNSSSEYLKMLKASGGVFADAQL